MFSNYFYLSRSVSESKNLLIRSKILDVYSQEKDVFTLRILTSNFDEKLIHLSTKQQFHYLQIKDKVNKAKKNVISFLKDFLPLDIIDINIHSNDRIVKFSLNKGNLFFLIRGNNSNVIFKTESSLLPFKKTKYKIDEELNDGNFYKSLTLDLTKEILNIKELKTLYPMLSSEMKNEILARVEETKQKNLIIHLQNLIQEISKNKIRVGFSKEFGKYKFVPTSFKSIHLFNYNDHELYNQAISDYLKNYYKTTKIGDIKKELSNYFERELGRLSNKLNNLKLRIDKGSKSDEYYNIASLLLSNIYKIDNNQSEIKLTDPKTNKEIKIKLDEKLSIKKNIDKYFEKAKDEKVNYKKSIELFNITLELYNNLLEKQKLLTNTENFNELKTLRDKLIKTNNNLINMNTGQTFKHWHYKINNKYNVYVGRDSKSNDYLSIKFAKQNDYWFHARGLPGSHVVLRVENTKEAMPKEIIKKAAQLAAYYSKAKTAGTAPVSYTFAKFVYKKKGMLPGKVMLSKEKSILVRPEIPKECELVNE